ncbi:hypothetical protein RJ639_045799 [Escallonia herrerae]|uniref:Retroviral polymerase SH3-like domain-containing protein n=1 Tax=Escallonia herrerae TaxID=1293975 RepID=A0AA88W814_9ASTE|nr:hypothetical protein RJ639_045799 [Escallonia herrerae]
MEYEECSKLDAKSRKCTFLDYETNVKGYRLWDPVAKKRIVSCNVVFDESLMIVMRQNAEKPEVVQNCGKTMEVEIDDRGSQEVDQQSMEDPVQHQGEQQSIAKGREKHGRKAPNRYGYEDMVSFTLVAAQNLDLSDNIKHADLKIPQETSVFEFIVLKLHALRKPKTNIQILQRSVLLKYKCVSLFDVVVGAIFTL